METQGKLVKHKSPKKMSFPLVLPIVHPRRGTSKRKISKTGQKGQSPLNPFSITQPSFFLLVV